jgi:hypothetical protein
MATLLEHLRDQLRERRKALVAELDELDDALSRMSGSNGASPKPASVTAPTGPKTGRGRKPGADAMRLERWLRSWVGGEPGGVIRIEDAFRRAVSAGQTSDDRAGRERLRAALERMVRQGEGENIGGGTYRFAETSENGGGP